jgi:hypothetical protein
MKTALLALFLLAATPALAQQGPAVRLEPLGHGMANLAVAGEFDTCGLGDKPGLISYSLRHPSTRPGSHAKGRIDLEIGVDWLLVCHMIVPRNGVFRFRIDTSVVEAGINFLRPLYGREYEVRVNQWIAGNLRVGLQGGLDFEPAR